jgi:hypothetical protein
MVNVTLLPGATRVPPTGDCAITIPGGATVEVADALVTTNPSDDSLSLSAMPDVPIRLGTTETESVVDRDTAREC